MDKLESSPLASVWPALEFRLAQHFDNFSFVGMALALVEKSKQELSYIFSKGSLAKEKELMSAPQDTLFRCANKGLLPSLDTPICEYIPEAKDIKLNEASRPFTFREVASHAAGIPQEGDFDRWEGGDMQDVATILKNLNRESPFPSYTRFHYSNIGFILLGLALQKIAKMPFNEYVSSHILKPLGMTSSCFEFNQDCNKEKEATGYFKDKTPTPTAQYQDCAPCGGMLTTLSDLAKYIRFLMTTESLEYKDILHPASVRELHAPVMMHWSYKPQQPQNLNLHAYGLGFFISSYEGEPVIHHSGMTWGFISDILWLPRLDVGCCMFYNTETKGLRELRKTVVELLVPALKTKLKPQKAPSKKECEGRLHFYKHKMGDRLRVSLPKPDQHLVRLDLYERDGEKTKGIAVIERRSSEEEKKELSEREFYIASDAGHLEGERFKFSSELSPDGVPMWVKRGHAYFYLEK